MIPGFQPLVAVRKTDQQKVCFCFYISCPQLFEKTSALFLQPVQAALRQLDTLLTLILALLRPTAMYLSCAYTMKIGLNVLDFKVYQEIDKNYWIFVVEWIIVVNMTFNHISSQVFHL